MYKNSITGETRTDEPRQYRAHYVGVCHTCQSKIDKGDYISWVRIPSKKAFKHINCASPTVWPWFKLAEVIESLPSMPVLESKPEPEIFPIPESSPFPEEEKPLADMTVTDEDEQEEILQAPSKPASTGSDGLLDMISARVEDKVINTVRAKLDAAIKVLDRSVQAKLDQLSIPSITVKRAELPDIKLHNVHKQFKDVLQLVSSSEYVYLHGSPGGHKSTIGPQLAESLGVRYGYMSLCEQTPEYVVKGFTSPIDGKYYPSQFVDFYENGGLFCWEEMDAANDNLRSSLNTMLENKIASLDKGMVAMHKDFYMIANGNTCGRGAHPAFPSRTSFDAAFSARFIFLEFEYDWQLCKHIALGLNPQAAPIVSWAEKVSNWALANGVQLVMSPREVYKLAKLTKTTTLSDDALLNGVIRGLDIPSREKMLSSYPFPSISRS